MFRHQFLFLFEVSVEPKLRVEIVIRPLVPFNELKGYKVKIVIILTLFLSWTEYPNNTLNLLG